MRIWQQCTERGRHTIAKREKKEENEGEHKERGRGRGE
jgi:hypothetical protein